MKDTSLAITLAGLSFMLTVIWGGPLLRVLRHFKIGKIIRVEEPERHMTKMGTPTMGGVMIIFPVTLLTILLNAVSLLGSGRDSAVPSCCRCGHDRLRPAGRGGRLGRHPWYPQRLGMRARTKFLLQVVLCAGDRHWACVTCWMCRRCIGRACEGIFDLGILYIPIATFIIVGMSRTPSISPTGWTGWQD